MRSILNHHIFVWLRSSRTGKIHIFEASLDNYLLVVVRADVRNHLSS